MDSYSVWTRKISQSLTLARITQRSVWTVENNAGTKDIDTSSEWEYSLMQT